jgi:hypothetical protein
MKPSTTGSRPLGFSPGRRLQLMMDPRHDPYKARKKPHTPAVCPDCALVCLKGRWQHAPAPEKAHRERCPACARIHDRFPAGYVTIEGPYAWEHRAEILETARHFAQRMQAEHPLERIIAIEESGDKVVITTTDIHVAQGIGRALYHAFHGNLHYSFSEGEYLLRVTWAA